jgi:hypothetical protein
MNKAEKNQHSPRVSAAVNPTTRPPSSATNECLPS